MSEQRSAWPTTTIKKSSYLRGRIGWQGLRASEFLDDGPFLITGTDFLDSGHIEWSRCYHVSEERFREGTYIHVREGDLLVTKDGTIGKIACVRDCPEKAVLNSGVFLLRCSDGSYEHGFLYQLLRSDLFDTFLRVNLAGSTISHLYQYVFERFEFPVPEKPVQSRIAEILSTVDEAIEETEVLITKTQQVKAGLMHDLFTRGVTESGQLRSAASSTTTPFGTLPHGWVSGSLLDVADDRRQPILTGPFGADLGNDDFVQDGVPVLRIGNVQAGHLDLGDLLFVTPRKANELQRYAIRTGDLLFARQGATTGRNALASDLVDGCLINYHIIRVALDHEKCAPLFIEAAFNEEIVKRQIERDKGRGTREGINTAQLKALKVPLAPVGEQRLIAEILRSQNQEVQCLLRELGKLRMLKDGLTQHLLTGRVPVIARAQDAGTAAANV